MKTEQQIKEEAIALYESASLELKKVLEAQFDPGFFEKKRQIIEEVLQFLELTKEQAIEKKILLFEFPKSKRERYLNAISLLPLIAEKINGGWEPDYNDRSQLKWQPYFEFKNGGWIAYAFAACFIYYADAGVRVYETEEKAVKAGKEWIDLYVDILNYTSK